jgi:cation/acetate symporter
MEPWLGIQSTSAGIWGVAIGFVTIVVVSLLTAPPSLETQKFIESVRFPDSP